MEPLVLGIIAISVALIFTIGLLLVYTGLFQDVDVNTGKPPISNVRLAYKFAQGPYNESGALFSEVVSIAPSLKTIAVYFDDPMKVEAAKRTYIVGAILCEGTSEADKDIETSFKEKDFKIATFPAVDHAVITSFPFIWTLSVFLANMKIWPKLGEYVQERNLCAHPAIEICTGSEIQYMLPLSKQEEFYVEEAKKARGEKASGAGEQPEGTSHDGDESNLHDTTLSSNSGGSGSGTGSESESSFEELDLKEAEVAAEA